MLGNITKENGEKCFLVFNTACFGDVLLCNSLVQNIKTIFPDSKVIFVVDKPFADVARCQQGVDEVVYYDKKGEHKGLFGLFKFVKIFKYINPYASIITYHNERNYLISKLLRCKKIVMNKRNQNDKYSVQEQSARLLNKLANESIINYPIKYNVPDAAYKQALELVPDIESSITVCFTSKKDSKDIPIETGIELIKKINGSGIKVVFTGAGEKARNYAQKLKENGCSFVDMTDKTSIPVLAAMINLSRLLLTVDTGTMHLGCAVAKKIIAVWYEDITKTAWMPDKRLYNINIIEDNQTADNIFSEIQSCL